MEKLTLLITILLTSITYAQVPSYVPVNGLVGWWPFNGNANDESGNGNNGTVNGATLTFDRNGVANQAYSFDGIDDYILANPIGNVSNSISFTFWIKSDNNSGEWNGILTNQNNNSQGFLIQENTNNHYDFTVSNGSGYYDLWSIDTINNDWKFITCIINNNNMFLFINGELDISQTIGSFQLSSTGNLNFGSRYLSEYYKGVLDDIGIWNRALTACEIKNLYNGEVPYSSQSQTALDTYTWPVNNQTYTQSGIYSDTLVNAAGCDSIVTLILTLSYTSINENNSSSLVISPNPTTGSFSLHGLEQLGTITSLRIIDNNGKVVQVLDPKATQFACSSLKTGVYFLEVISSTSNEIIKLIKE
jgi:hypothetical protein